MACGTIGGASCFTTIFSTGIVTTPVVTTVESVFTTTRQIITTCQATPGQTVTITPPPPPWQISPPVTLPPSTVVSLATISSTAQAYTTSTVVTSSTFTIQQPPTVTMTEIVVVLESPSEGVYSTSTITLSMATTTLTSQISPSPIVVIVGQDHRGGWNAWSDAQKGGLIAGCIIAFFTIAVVIMYCCGQTRSMWVAHDWSSGGGGGGGQAMTLSQAGYMGFGHNRRKMRGGEGDPGTGHNKATFYQPPVSR